MTHIIVHNYAPKRRRTRDMISVGTGPVQDQPSLGRITPGLGPQTQKTKDVPGSGPYTFETKTKQEGWGKSNHVSQPVGDIQFTGTVIKEFGKFKVIEGIGLRQGEWQVKGPGITQIFKSKSNAIGEAEFRASFKQLLANFH